MKIRIVTIAQQEFVDAQDFYEVSQPGLGLRFSGEIKRALMRIQKHPLAGAMEKGEVRRSIVHSFPYKILYSIQNDEIVVLAFAHQHRHNEYWIERL